MDKEHIILDNLSKNENITQRELSHITGLSLGSINLLIGKLIDRGLIKAEHVSVNTLKYILTPKGLMEKSKKTYNYIRQNYLYIIKTQNQIIKIINELIEKNGEVNIIIEDGDELSELTKLAVNGTNYKNRIRFMKKSEKMGNNIHIIACDGDEIYKEGNIVYLSELL